MRCLLVNPWIYDFAAYDLWNKPLGLLYLGGVLRGHGWKIDLLDCLDRTAPELAGNNKQKFRKYNTGKYVKHYVKKPPVLDYVPRYYNRYGMPEKIVRERLKSLEKPDAILLTSGMTYWYPALIDIVSLLKEYFPSVPVILGGIYASLVPEHARRHIPVDRIVAGEAESTIQQVLAEMPGVDSGKSRYDSIDDIPFPALELYDNLPYLPLLTSRGCPMRCSFCASYRISGKFRMRSVASVLEELTYFQKKFSVRHVAFYDDALLFRKEDHLQPLLEHILERGLVFNFHTPNGLHADAIDKQTASLMVRAGFKTIRISLETIAETRRSDMSGKVTPEGFLHAVESFAAAGFPRSGIETYILMGLPGQSALDVLDTVFFAAAQGVLIRPALFSPIPGTKDWERAVSAGDLHADADLLETNNTVYICRTQSFSREIVTEIKQLIRNLNECNTLKLSLPDKKKEEQKLSALVRRQQAQVC